MTCEANKAKEVNLKYREMHGHRYDTKSRNHYSYVLFDQSGSNTSTLKDDTVMFSTKVIKPKIITKIANHSFYNQKSNNQKSRRQTPKPCLFDLSLAMPSKRVPTAPKFGQITLKRFRNKTIQIAKEPKKASPQRPFILSSRKTSQ